MGWLVAFIIVAVLGNLYLFSGYDVEGDLAIFMVACGIIGDLILIGYIPYKLIKKSEEEQRRKELQEQLDAANAEKKQREERERLLKILNNKVQQKIASYSISNFRIKITNTSQTQKLPNANFELCDCYRQYCAALADFSVKIEELYKKSQDIIACRGCYSDEARLKHLEQNEQELLNLRREAEEISQKANKIKIHITNFDYQPLTKLRNALSFLKQSKRHTATTEITRDVFFENTKPKELEAFQYSVTPVLMNFGKACAVCFPKVILLFEDGVFRTALNPSAMSIKVLEHQENATYYLDKKEYAGSNHAADDSLLVEQGFDRITWLYTKRDGGPDLRYSYNPATRFRNDTVVYGEVRITIGDYQAGFIFSSKKAIDALKEAQRTFCEHNATISNPIPLLLDLLAATTSDREKDISHMREMNALKCEAELPVCRIIGMEAQLD